MNIDTNMQKKILILEDNLEITELLTEWLSSFNYEICSFQQVDDIIKLTEEIGPDLIIVDYLLGGINGGEYCAQLKKHSGTKLIPVLMLSAHQRVIESLGHYGWDAFMAKPFDLEELVLKVRSLIRRYDEALQIDEICS